MVANTMQFFGRYFLLNLQGAMEYRTSFVLQIVGMLINDFFWLCFWYLFFSRFQNVGGYSIQDVVVVWAIVAGGFGWVHGFFGNLGRITQNIALGQFDFYLVLPKNVLWHFLVSRVNIAAWGDVLFALLAFFLFGDPSWERTGLFFLFLFCSGLTFLFFEIFIDSLGFFLGGASSISGVLINSTIMFSTYPAGIFKGILKALLYLVIPAGFIAYIPVELMREFAWQKFFLLLFGISCFGILSQIVFWRGIKRYESGNLMTIRD